MSLAIQPGMRSEMSGRRSQWASARGQRMRVARIRILVVAMLVIGCGASLAQGEEWIWRGGGASGDEAPTSVARDPLRGRVALGDASGFSVWTRSSTRSSALAPGERERFALAGVRDLAFDSAGTLWLATQEGLFRWNEDGRPLRRSLRGGDLSNQIRRVEPLAMGLVVATEGDAFWTTSGATFQRLPVGGASLPVDLVAGVSDPEVSGAATRIRLWIHAGDQLHSIRALVTPNGLRVTGSQRIASPRPIADARPVDLRVTPSGSRLVVLYEDALAWKLITEEASKSDPNRWTILRPVLPPGAKMQRIVWAEAQIWVATDHGLVVGERLAGPFARASPPVGTATCRDLDRGQGGSDSEGLVVLCRRGIFERATARESSSLPVAGPGVVRRQPPLLISIPPLPPLAVLRERALDLAGLSTSRSVALRKGLARRAYWPDLSLRLGADVDRDQARDSDQAFVSGATRQLYDHSRDRRLGYGASIELEWDLGGIAYPEDSVDLSRELRQIVSLRDDVSDEINQLYFARLAVAEELSDLGGSPSEDPRGRWRRLRELDAGLDAWTAGWLTRWRLDRSRSDPDGLPANPSSPRRNEKEERK